MIATRFLYDLVGPGKSCSQRPIFSFLVWAGAQNSFDGKLLQHGFEACAESFKPALSIGALVPWSARHLRLEKIGVLSHLFALLGLPT